MSKTVIKRLLAVLLALSLCTALSGCDFMEIDQIVSVMGAAIDYDPATGRYSIAAEIAKLSEDPKQPVEPVLLEGDGVTIAEALTDMGQKTAGTLYYLHSVLFALSEAAANDVEQIVDTIMRSAQSQRVVHVAVVKGGKAADLLKVKPKTRSLISIELSEAITTQSERYAATCDMELYRLYNDVPAGLSSLLPALVIEGEGDQMEAKVDGAAILSRGKLTGYLTADETRYCMLATGQFKEGFITFQGPDADEPFTLRVSSVEAQCAPTLRDGRLTVEMDLYIKGTVPEFITKADEQERASMSRLSGQIEAQITEQAKRVMDKVYQQCGADLQYLQPTIEHNHRAQWPSLSENWPQILGGAEAKVKAAVHLYSNGISR